MATPKEILAVTGPTIGHIRDGKYVALADEKPKSVSVGSTVDLKDWANVAICEKCFSDMLKELCEVFTPEDALTVICARRNPVAKHSPPLSQSDQAQRPFHRDARHVEV